MSIGLYDKAVTDKIKKWVVDANINVLYPDEVSRLFQQQADMKNDKPLDLPLIAVSRDPNIQLNNISRRPMTFSGKTFVNDGRQSDHLNGIPITLDYMIDIYTRFRAESDEFVRNFVFKLINTPKITIEIPYNDCNLEYTSYMELDPTITDNSDIPERLVSGQFTRMSIVVHLKDAYLFSYKKTYNTKITTTELYLNEDNTVCNGDKDECELIATFDNN